MSPIPALHPERPLAVIHHSSFRAFAGAEMVTAWTIQALMPTYRVVLWVDHRPDWIAVDARFSTSLAKNPPSIHTPAPRWRSLAACLRGKGQLLQESLAQREMQAFDRKYRPTVWIGTCNESWLPKPGFLYIHHPDCWRLADAPIHWSLWRRRRYRCIQRASCALGLNGSVPPARHRKLINSAWAARRYAQVGGGHAQVLYPPVPPFAPGLPWAQREDRVVVLGRWSAPKRLTLAIEIVSAARHAGAKLILALAGFWHTDAETKRQVLAAAAGCDWIEWHENPTRDAIMRLAGSSRYGLHAMREEHFGIAVAELATAGCIVLVPASGGPCEIIEDPRQIYADAGEGTAKLLALHRSEDLQLELHARSRARGLRFHPDVFVQGMLAALSAHP